MKGRCIAELVKKYPHIFPDFDSFQASSKYIKYQGLKYFKENAQLIC